MGAVGKELPPRDRARPWRLDVARSFRQVSSCHARQDRRGTPAVARCGEKSDPLSSQVHVWQSMMLISAGRYDEAAGHCEKLPADWNGWLGRARFWQGRTGEAIQILETAFNRGVNEEDTVRAILAMPTRGPAAARMRKSWQPLARPTHSTKP